MLENSPINRKKIQSLSRICCAGFVLLSLSLELFKKPVDVAFGHTGIWFVVSTAVLG